ncbi:MAG: hypothetical protein JNM84_06415 [Planctomycetes bacterium]|nr:hypothetical protein [Planctomycetota bacterium]
MSTTYEQRARACIERALEGLGLKVVLERWDHPACSTPELAVVVRGKSNLRRVDLHQRGHHAFGIEFQDDEPWPILSIQTESAGEDGTRQDHREAS